MVCLCILAGAFNIQVISEAAVDGPVVVQSCPGAVFGPLAGSTQVHMFHTTEDGDTLWSSPLEGTSTDFYNPPVAVCGTSGTFLVNVPPDCFSGSTPLQLISPDGITLWHLYLNTESLVEECDFVELPPRINAMTELSNGDFIAAGHVSPFLGAPARWFVACIDGVTGKLLWKTDGYERGFAKINAVIEVSGSIFAVGATAESVSPGAGAPDMVRTAGDYNPMIVLLESTGDFIGSRVFELQLTKQFTGISSVNHSSFLLTGSTAEIEVTTETEVEAVY